MTLIGSHLGFMRIAFRDRRGRDVEEFIAGREESKIYDSLPKTIYFGVLIPLYPRDPINPCYVCIIAPPNQCQLVPKLVGMAAAMDGDLW